LYSHRFQRVDGRWLFSALACDLSLEAPLPG